MMATMRSARSRLILAALLGCTLLAASPAHGKSYSAERFDSSIRVLPGGILEVTETVVFRFEDGTFTEVFREIPTRRTDGIEIVRAELQGKHLPVGTERETVEVRQRSNRVRVTWRFGPVAGVTREFVLHYRVHGAVGRDDRGDVLTWRATPGEHRYRIDSSRIQFAVPSPLDAPPVLASRKSETPEVNVAGNSVNVLTTDIRENGWVEVTLTFPRGALVAALPAWQQHAADVSAQSVKWIAGAVLVLLAGFIFLFAWRQSYDSPPRDLQWTREESVQDVPPEPGPPALAGVLAANGRATLEHAMAALFTLAERGDIHITETRAAFQRGFQITRRRLSSGLTGYEREVLDTIFKGEDAQGSTVTLSQARSRLARRSDAFAREVTRELLRAGLVDESRKAVRDRYTRAALWLLGVGVVGLAPAGFLTRQYGGWPLLIPAAILLLSLLSVIFAATVTPLSNDGVRRAHRWRDYRKHLNAVAHGKRIAADDPSRLTLAFAVAFGLASAWSKFLKQRGHTSPPWFHALPGHDDRTSFPAFIAAGGATASGAHGGGGGGVAGGGASGAR